MSYLGKISKGSLYTSDGSKYLERTAGTDGQPLVSDSTQDSGLNYETASGAGSYELISTVNASGVSSVEFTDLTSDYSAYEIWFQNTGSASPRLRVRTSSNNGSSYDSGASDYEYIGNANSANVFASASSSSIILQSADGSPINGESEIRLTLFNPSDSNYTSFYWLCKNWVSIIAMSFGVGVGRRRSASAVDAIQFTYTDSSNITGIFKLYGIKSS